jgi:cytidylate kinase
MRTPRSVSAIVDEQVNRWQMQRQREPDRSAGPAPMITVSRQYGAHGGALARRIADQLGFACWNRELIAAMARHAHTEEQVLQAFDEHHRTVLVDAISGMIPRPAIGPSDYFRELGHVVHSIARHGGAVVVGRGVQFMLDPSHVLRVRIVAPADQRARSLCERHGLDFRSARAEVDERDRDRRDFIRDHYGRDIDDPADYDLVVNLERLTDSAAIATILSAFHGRFATAARASMSL